MNWTADSGLPRKIVQLDLPGGTGPGEFQLPTIALSPPLLVGGTVCFGTSNCQQATTSQRVTNATVSFFALDANGHGVLLGSGPTDTSGHYKVVLPDVAQPGVATGR